jgi:hypothetical protein
VRERGVGPSGTDRAVSNAPHGTIDDAAPIGIIFHYGISAMSQPSLNNDSYVTHITRLVVLSHCCFNCDFFFIFSASGDTDEDARALFGLKLEKCY